MCCVRSRVEVPAVLLRYNFEIVVEWCCSDAALWVGAMRYDLDCQGISLRQIVQYNFDFS